MESLDANCKMEVAFFEVRTGRAVISSCNSSGSFLSWVASIIWDVLLHSSDGDLLFCRFMTPIQPLRCLLTLSFWIAVLCCCRWFFYMFKQLVHLIILDLLFQLSLLVFWSPLGNYFSNSRFSIFRLILVQISSSNSSSRNLYPFTDYSMNKDITSSAYQWSSGITTSTHHLISRRSSLYLVLFL